MRDYKVNIHNKRVTERSIREALLARIAAAIAARGLKLQDLREIDPRLSRNFFDALRDEVDGILSRERLHAIAEGLEVLDTEMVAA